jgi:recombination protein RecT
MTVKQIENHEKKFRKGEYQSKGWRDDWDAMARKTVYRILIGKWGVMSITYQNAQEGIALAQQMRDEDVIEADAVEIDGEGNGDEST